MKACVQYSTAVGVCTLVYSESVPSGLGQLTRTRMKTQIIVIVRFLSDNHLIMCFVSV